MVRTYKHTYNQPLTTYNTRSLARTNLDDLFGVVVKSTKTLPDSPLSYGGDIVGTDNFGVEVGVKDFGDAISVSEYFSLLQQKSEVESSSILSFSVRAITNA